MKLVTYKRDSKARPGMIIEDSILDLQDGWSYTKDTGAFPKDILSLLKKGTEALAALQNWVSQKGDTGNHMVPLSGSQLLPPRIIVLSS